MINGQLFLSQGEWESWQKKGCGEISSSQKGKTPVDDGTCSKSRDRGHGRGGRGNASHAGTRGRALIMAFVTKATSGVTTVMRWVTTLLSAKHRARRRTKQTWHRATPSWHCC